MNPLIPEVQNIMTLAKNYAERHQIIYSDVHEAMVLMVIKEAIKLSGNHILGIKTTYDMDIYSDQVPNTGIDYNKRGHE